MCNGCFGRETPSPLPPPFPDFLLLSRILYSTGYSCGQCGSAVPAMSPRNLLPTPILLAFMGKGVERKPWCCASPVQQQPNQWCVTNTVLATTGKHSTVLAAVRITLVTSSQTQYTILVMWMRSMLDGMWQPGSCSGMSGHFRLLLLMGMLRAEVAVKRGSEELLS